MLSVVERHVIARESNVVRVDFSREPDPPAPCCPGAGGLRLSVRDGEEALRAIAIGTPKHNEGTPRSENFARRLKLHSPVPDSVRD